MPNIPPRIHAEERPPLPQTLFVLPAYGRSYANGSQAKADWFAGLDFKIVGASYLSLRDLDYLVAHGVACVSVVNEHGDVIYECPLIGVAGALARESYLSYLTKGTDTPRGKP